MVGANVDSKRGRRLSASSRLCINGAPVTWYTFFKAVHVVAAAVWIGGATTLQALAFRITRSGDARRTAGFAKDAEFVGTRVFIPTTWILLLAGIAMMINFDWPWGQNWVVFGFIAFALSFVIGASFL